MAELLLGGISAEQIKGTEISRGDWAPSLSSNAQNRWRPCQFGKEQQGNDSRLRVDCMMRDWEKILTLKLVQALDPDLGSSLLRHHAKCSRSQWQKIQGKGTCTWYQTLWELTYWLQPFKPCHQKELTPIINAMPKAPSLTKMGFGAHTHITKTIMPCDTYQQVVGRENCLVTKL